MKINVYLPVLFVGFLGVSGQATAKDVLAQAICKCVGDSQCGGGQIHREDFYTLANCKNSQKDADNVCNGQLAHLCSNKTVGGVEYKCRYRHTDKKCPK